MQDLPRAKCTGAGADMKRAKEPASLPGLLDVVLLEVNRLSEGAVSCRVPHRKPHPFLSRRVEGHTELVAAERRHSLHIDDLPVDRVSVAPYQLRKFGRKGPFRFRRIGALPAGAFDVPVAEEHLVLYAAMYSLAWKGPIDDR